MTWLLRGIARVSMIGATGGDLTPAVAAVRLIGESEYAARSWSQALRVRDKVLSR